jgi:hypothetical protein
VTPAAQTPAATYYDRLGSLVDLRKRQEASFDADASAVDQAPAASKCRRCGQDIAGLPMTGRCPMCLELIRTSLSDPPGSRQMTGTGLAPAPGAAPASGERPGSGMPPGSGMTNAASPPATPASGGPGTHAPRPAAPSDPARRVPSSPGETPPASAPLPRPWWKRLLGLS